MSGIEEGSKISFHSHFLGCFSKTYFTLSMRKLERNSGLFTKASALASQSSAKRNEFRGHGETNKKLKGENK